VFSLWCVLPEYVHEPSQLALHDSGEKERWQGRMHPEAACLVSLAGRPEDEALDTLRIVSAALATAAHLKELNLSDNALGEKGVRACSEVFAKQVCREPCSEEPLVLIRQATR